MRTATARPVPGRESWTFVQCGAFSGTNTSLLPRLAAEFPGLEARDFDVAPWLRREPGVLAATAWSALREYGWRTFTERGALRRGLYRSAGFERKVRARMGAVVGECPHAFTLQTQSLFDAAVAGVPHFVYTDHTALANSYYPEFDPASVPPAELDRERRIYQNATLVFTMGSHVARSLEEHYEIEPGKVRVVGAGANVGAAAEDRVRATRAGRILFVGRDWERKGGPQLRQALALVRCDHPEATLTVVGCSPDVSQDGVEVLGERPYEEVADLYRKAAIFCMPTRNEPFGLVYVEALSFGIPVVAADIGAVGEIVVDGECGLLVAVDDVEGLAEALAKLLSDPVLARRLGDRGRERVARLFTWERVAASIAAGIREEIGRRGDG